MRKLSKSRLISFRQCAKRLWLEMHHPELREDSAATVASFAVGHTVGAFAQQIYDPKGRGSIIDAQTEGYDAAFARSRRLLGAGTGPVFEAGLSDGGVIAFADVMLPVKRRGSLQWRMVEVKSSTSLKDYHRDDVAVQTYLARQARIPLHSVAVATIDASWVYPGDGDYRGLLVETDLTQEAMGRDDEVRAWIAEARVTAALTAEPQIAMGAHCYDPFECGFCNYCGRDLVRPKFPLTLLPRFQAKRRDALLAQGIDDLRGVPDDALNAQQRRVKAHTLAGTVYFDRAGAAADLAGAQFPACFLDFESIQFGVPTWAGTRPYQQIPFQFSLHRLSRPGGQLEHVEFLDLTGDNPSGRFAEALVRAGGEEGTIYVYNAAFEQSRIRELIAQYPGWADGLRSIQNRIVDLLPIARDRYYHPSQQGSWSLKAVLPAAVPGLNYGDLGGVQGGDEAMQAYLQAIAPGVGESERSRIDRELRAYCRLDTLALVRLWEVFRGERTAARVATP
jgi:hypothetical protein